VPLVGKSTFIRENFEGINVISRDEILMEAVTRDYTEAWKMQTKICGFYFI
jgi:predicted kinase